MSNAAFNPAESSSQPPRGEMVVMEIVSQNEVHSTRAVAVNKESVVLRRTPGDTAHTRFLWLEFMMPDGERLRALGEVTGRDVETTSVKLKHLWPRDRARYMQLVASAFAPIPATPT